MVDERRSGVETAGWVIGVAALFLLGSIGTLLALLGGYLLAAVGIVVLGAAGVMFPLAALTWGAFNGVAALGAESKTLDESGREELQEQSAQSFTARGEGSRAEGRARKARYFGKVEAAMLLGLAVLLVWEAASIWMNMLPATTVVVLGYVIVMGWIYAVYRLSSQDALSRMSGAVAETGRERRPASETLRRLRQTDVFAGLSVVQVAAVEALGRRVGYAAGEVLGRAGQAGDSIFVILEGQAELTAPSGVGEVTVRIAQAGETLPLAALLGEGRLITTITAMRDMEALLIQRDELLRLCREEPGIGVVVYANIAGILAGRYQATLLHFTRTAEEALHRSELWANV